MSIPPNSRSNALANVRLQASIHGRKALLAAGVSNSPQLMLQRAR